MDGDLVAQADSAPRNGKYPTRFWEPGESINDSYALSLEAVPKGNYELKIGFYSPNTGDRLFVLSKGEEISQEFVIKVNINK